MKVHFPPSDLLRFMSAKGWVEYGSSGAYALSDAGRQIFTDDEWSMWQQLLPKPRASTVNDALWFINIDGTASKLDGSRKLSCDQMRFVVKASSPEEAKAECAERSFLIGVRNATKDEPAEISISGEIGDSYTQSDAKSVHMFLQANRGRPVTVRINSGGGLAWDGISMSNAIRNHDAPVTAIIESIAGSAATLPAVAASKTVICENAQFFIHRASMGVFGNRDTMAEAMDWLDAIDEAIASTYKAKTNKAMEKIRSQMKGTDKRDGTVFMARDAVAEKYCNEVQMLKQPAKNLFSGSASASGSYVDAMRATRMRNALHMGYTPANSVVERVVQSAQPTAKQPDQPKTMIGERIRIVENGVVMAEGLVSSMDNGLLVLQRGAV